MKKEIYLLTGYDNFFGQTRKPWVSIDTNAFVAELSNLGLKVTPYQFHELCNNKLKVSDSIVIYTFSQRANLRSYMKDVIYSLNRQGNTIIPGYDLLLCHENKGIQENLKRKLGIVNLPALYLSSKRELNSYDLNYPLVLKTLEGSNGRGVFLINDRFELNRTLDKLEGSLSLILKLDLWRRKYLRLAKHFQGYNTFNRRKDFEQYKDYITPEIGFVLQNFVPDLKFDYRVIILGDSFYVTKRLTREGDFRASGAKRFTFDFKAPDALLDYAKDLFARFDAPCLSLDIGAGDNEYYLFEFQALHFGINAIVRGRGYYQETSKGWQFIEKPTVFEKALAGAYHSYLKRKNLL